MPFLKARGKPGRFTPVDLAVQCGRPLPLRQNFAAEAIDLVILGCVNVIQDEMNPACVAALRLGLGEQTAAFSVQINCGSDMHSIGTVARRPVSLTDHAVGLHVARLIGDGGTLQIGIGAVGDAVVHALMLRQAGKAAAIHKASPRAPDGFAEHGAFDRGLHAVTEMLVDGVLQLYEAGIIRREVDGAAVHAGFFVDCRRFYDRRRTPPGARRGNRPETIERWLKPFDLPAFPFGTDFDATEQRLLPALALLSETQGDPLGMLGLIRAGVVVRDLPEDCLQRMGLAQPSGLRERLEGWALRGALARSG